MDDKIRKIVGQMLNRDLEQLIMSNSRDSKQASKIKVRPVLIKEQLLFQETVYRGTQVFHSNFSKEEMEERILDNMEKMFGQAQIKGLSTDGEIAEGTILVSKKGTVTVKTKKSQKTGKNDAVTCGKPGCDTTDQGMDKEDKPELTHNRTKQYILQEGAPIDFLVGLDVMTPDGKVKKERYDKFRQINRYLEFIADVLEDLPKEDVVRIIDFGCGKSYLTFAMYYYLHEMQHLDVEINGLDLKKDVIERCNALAAKLGYKGLSFEQGDIADYSGATRVDLVVSLHACDTATDHAIAKAIGWDAKVILAVPCCQHELNRQIKNDMLKPILKYGVIKERITALMTDAVRANLLEEQGYKVQILEFIDMEHTPKNLLIRAVKNTHMRATGNKVSLDQCLEELHLNPTLQKLLDGSGKESI